MSDNIKFVQSQEYKLAGAGAASTDITIRVRNFTQIDGTTLTMTNFGIKGFGTLEPNTSREEQIVWTGITDNGDNTSTLTGVSRVLTVDPYTETSGIASAHAGGTIFVVSDNPGLLATMANKKNDETIEETWTFTAPNYPLIDTPATPPTTDGQFTPKKFVNDEDLKLLPLDATRAMTAELNFGTNKAINLVDPTAAQDAATKKYVDDTAVAGAPNASETVKGIVEVATQAEFDAGTDTGGTGAQTVAKPSQIKTRIDSVEAGVSIDYPGVGNAVAKPFENFQIQFGAQTDGVSPSPTLQSTWVHSSNSFDSAAIAFLTSSSSNGAQVARTRSGLPNYNTGGSLTFSSSRTIIFEQTFRRGANNASANGGMGIVEITSTGLAAGSNQTGVFIVVDSSGVTKAHTGNGTTVTETALTIANDTSFTLRIEYIPTTNAKFFIDGTLVATHTTNLPTSSTIISYLVHNVTLSSNKVIDIFGAPSFAIQK